MTVRDQLGNVLRVVSDRLAARRVRAVLEFVAGVSGTVLATSAPNPPVTGLERLQIVGGAVLITAAGASAGTTIVAAILEGVRREVRAAVRGEPEPELPERSGTGVLHRLLRPLIAVALFALAVVVAWSPVAALGHGLWWAVHGCPTARQLRMVAEPETITTARELAAAYERRGAEDDYGCAPAQIYVFPATATSIAEHVTSVDAWSDGSTALRDVGPRPDLWLASTGHEVDALHTVVGSSPIVDRFPVARSPLVLAVPAPAGQPGLGWSALFRRYTDGDQGVARPSASGELGLLATALLYGSERVAVGSGAVPWPGLNAADIEQRLARAGDTASSGVGDEADVLCRRRAEPPPLPGAPPPPAIITSEQEVARYNAGLPLGESCGAGAPDPTRQLTAVYPTDTGDQDLQLVRLAWGDPTPQQQAASAFATWLRSDAGRTALVRTGLRPLGPHPLDAPLTTGFGVSPALSPASGPVPDDRLVEADRSHAAAQRPSRLLFAFDTSGSMDTPEAGGTRAQVAAAAVAAGLRHLGANDDFGLWFFPGDGGAGHFEKVPLGRRTPERLADADAALAAIRPDHGTPLFRTIVDGVTALAPTALRAAPAAAPDDPTAVRALVVLTDGEDTAGEISASATADEIKDRGVRVVVVAIGGVSCAGGGLPAIVGLRANDCVGSDASTLGDRVAKIVDQLKGGT